MLQTAQGATGMGAGYETTATERAPYERREEEYGTTAGAGAVPAVAMQQTTVPVAASTGETQVARQGAEEVCGREYFTKVGGRHKRVCLLHSVPCCATTSSSGQQTN